MVETQNTFFQTILFKERINCSKLQALISCDDALIKGEWWEEQNIEFKGEMIKQEKDALQMILNDTYYIDEHYYLYTKYISKSNYGRVYPLKSKSLGSMRRAVRHFLTDDIYWDIDIINCHFSICVGKCKDFNYKSAVNIQVYVENRQKILEKYMKMYDKTSGDIKVMLIVALNGGSIQKWLDENTTSKTEPDNWLKEFQRECKDVAQIFKAHTSPELWSILTHHTTLEHKKMSSFMAKFLQMEEESILRIFYDLALDKGIIQYGECPLVLCHDGCMIEKSLFKDKQTVDSFIKELNDTVYFEKGYVCDFKIKKQDEGRKIQDILTSKNIKMDTYVDEWMNLYNIRRNDKINDDDNTLANLFYETQKNK